MKIPSFIAGKLGATSVCLLAYFVMAGLLTQMGVVKLGIESAFNISSSDAARVFSWLLTGVLVGTTASNFIYRWLKIKSIFLISYIPLTVIMFAMSVVPSIEAVKVLMGLSGALIGLGLSNSIVTLSILYQGKYRASSLVSTDLAFTCAGFTIPVTASYLLSNGLPWYSGYIVMAVVSLICALLSIFNRFPETFLSDNKASAGTNSKISVEVWLLALAAFLLLFGQNAFSIWSPTFVVERMNGTLMEGGSAIGNYWAMAMPATLLVVFILGRPVLTVSKFLLLMTPLMAIATSILYLSPTTQVFILAAGAYGMFSAGSYKTVVSFGAELSINPRALTIMLTAGTLGSMSSPTVTSFANDLFGVEGAFILAPISLFSVFLCISAVLIRLRLKQRQPEYKVA